MHQTKLLKIIVPLVIVLLVAGIWFLKNTEKMQGTRPENVTTELASSNAAVETKSPVEANDPQWELFVTEALDLEKLKSYGVPIIIDFGADSCIPCKEMAPVLKKLNNSLRGKAIIRFVDVWKNGDLSKGFPIEVIPTQIFIDKDGNPYKPSDAFAQFMMMYQNKKTSEHVFTAHQGGLTEEEMMAILLEMGMVDE